MVGETRLRNALMVFLVVVLAAATACSDSEGSSVEEDTGQDLAIPESDGPQFITPEVGDEVESPFTVEIDYGPIDPSGESVASDAAGTEPAWARA